LGNAADVDIPETKFTNVGEDRIAYQVLGEGALDLVYFSGVVSNVDLRWEEPLQERWFRRLASFSRVILFDKRGFGVSDSISGPRESLYEQWADDVRAVMDACGSRRAAIYGNIDAGPSAMLFAATHPDRTAALVLHNASARWIAADDYPQGMAPQTVEAMISTIENVWGRDDVAYAAIPDVAADEQVRRRFARFTRGSARPREIATMLQAIAVYDVRQALPLISAPTLVLHGRQHALIPLAQGRYLAEHIRGSRLVELEGWGTMITRDNMQDVILDAVQEFLTGTKPEVEIDRVLATVLFTDIVGSTERAAALGDQKWKDLLESHDALARSLIERYRGRVVKTTGDGVLATFDGPGRAIRCAQAVQVALRPLGIDIRAGLHSGEVELRSEDIGGIAVHIAARVAAQGGPGDVLVSGAVPPLVAGSGIEFNDRGTHELKGVPGEWRLFAVRE